MADLTLVHAGVHAGHIPVPGGPGDALTPNYTMPMGCLYLCAALQQHGYSVDFRDYQFTGEDNPYDPDNLVRFCDGCAPILGISCMADFLPIAVLAAERVKRVKPETMVVMGGPGPSDCPEALLAAFPWIDVAVVGEGELTLLELMDRLSDRGPRSLDDVPGLVFRDRHGVHRTAPRPRIRDLDSLPFPHPTGIDLRRYHQANLVTSRGCPYDCAFCDVTQLWDRRTTYRRLDCVVDEMRALHRMGFRQISLQDDNLTVSRRRIVELCEKTTGASDVPAWACLGRVDAVDTSLLSMMRAGGCRGIFFGVESGSDDVLRHIMKRTTARAAARAVELSVDQFGETEAYFIWGFPVESAADLMKTMLLMAYCRSLGALTALSLAAPLPRTTLYNRFRHDLSLDARFAPFSFFTAVRRGLHDARVEELIRLFPAVFSPFYTFNTPEAEAKLAMMRRFKPLNDLELMRPALRAS